MFSQMTTQNRLLLLTLCLVLSWNALPAAAQSVDADPVDLHFEVINATTGEPTSVERMTIEYIRTRRNGILDFEPSGSSFVAPGVPIKGVGKYIVAVWYHDVPYWWSMRGQQLMDETMTLHVFDTTDKLDGVKIKGLNLVIRRQETLLQLEYMIQIENSVTPQRTIYDRTATFELDFPAGASNIEATYRRGPDPTPFEAQTRGSSQLSLAVPLTPGLNHLRIEAVLPWREGMEVPLGSNLDIADWSALVSPEWLEVQAMELESGEGAELPGFTRWSGPALDAGRHFPLRLLAGEVAAGPTEDLFTQESGATDAGEGQDDSEQEKDGGLPLPFMFGGFFIIILVVAAVLKRK
jgi:hypothetical protein